MKHRRCLRPCFNKEFKSLNSLESVCEISELEGFYILSSDNDERMEEVTRRIIPPCLISIRAERSERRDYRDRTQKHQQENLTSEQES